MKITAIFSYFHTANDNVKFAGINSANVGDDFVKAAKLQFLQWLPLKIINPSSSSNRMSEQDLFEQFSEILLETKDKIKNNSNLLKMFLLD